MTERATTPFVRFSILVFGRFASHRIRQHPDLGIRLAKARNPLVPTAYLAATFLRTTLAGLIGVIGLGLYLAFGGSDLRMTLALAVSPVMLGGFAYSFDMVRPDLEVSARRRDLEAHLPASLNLMAALAGAGVLPSEVFGALGKNPVYGEVQRQARAIHRDTVLFSIDLVTALQEGARRSPSRQWTEFLQGAVNTVTSGGDLSAYMLARAEQVSSDNRRKQRAFLESLGVMAESYVVVAAAAPLFLLVILSVMAILRDSDSPVRMLNLLVLVGLPMIHGTFTYVMRTMRSG